MLYYENKLNDFKFGILKKIDEENIDSPILSPLYKESTTFFSPIGVAQLPEIGDFHLYTTKEEFSSIQLIEEMLHCSNPQTFEENLSKINLLQEKTEFLLKETFPAIELNERQLIESIHPNYIEGTSKTTLNLSKNPNLDLSFDYSKEVLGKLDYGIQISPYQTPHFLLMIPDAKTLEQRIQTIFNEKEINYCVKILKDPNILSDESFIQAYLEYDIVISEGKEELHDHFIHAIPTASLMLEDPKAYIQEKERIKTLIQTQIDKIKKEIDTKKILSEDAKILWLSLSFTIDTIWSSESIEDLKRIDCHFFNETAKSFFETDISQTYLQNRFPHIQEIELKNLRSKVIEKYDLQSY